MNTEYVTPVPLSETLRIEACLHDDAATQSRLSRMADAAEKLEQAAAPALPAAEPDGYVSYGEFRWACDCDERMRATWLPVWQSSSAALSAPTINPDTIDSKLIGAADPSNGWLPIETAPRDGSLVVLAGGDLMRPIFAWWTARGYWAGDQRGPYEAIPYTPAYWQPLPPPPATDAQEGGK